MLEPSRVEAALSRFSMRRTLLGAGLVAGVGMLAGAVRVAQARGQAEYAFSGETMGTTYHVRLASTQRDDALAVAARDAVDAALQAVDRRMSTFRADSELSQLNRLAPGRSFELSEPLADVLATAQQVSRASDGAFDITAGRFVNAWGFGPDRQRRVVPAGELAQLQRAVGYGHLGIDLRARMAVKDHPHVFADLSGVAKGFGVDQAARALQALGVQAYVIEAGGEVRASGRRPDGQAWQVGIEQPQAWPQRARVVLPLADMAMATSGDYRIYFERGGRRYCHEIDPVTGCPIAHNLASVTVLAASCAQADAFATALIVLGPVRGPALAERLGMPAYFILRDPDGALRDRHTAAFAALRTA